MKKLWNPIHWGPHFYGILAIFLLALNLFGPKGILHWLYLKNELNILSQKLEHLSEEKNKSLAELQRFQNSTYAQERTIREELGYLKPDELSIEFISNARSNSATTSSKK